MRQQFRLPDLGEGLTEAELVQWTVQPGETVALNQTIAEVETAKAVVELPSPFSGVVHELRADPGETVDVGSVIIVFEVEGPAEDDPDRGAELPPPNLVGYGARGESSGRPRRRARRDDRKDAVAAPSGVTVVPAPQSASAPASRVRATPLVRKIARDLGIDLSHVVGTGPTGRVNRADVEAFAAQNRTGDGVVAPLETGAPSPAAGERITRTPIRGVRKATAAAMVRSAFTAPHVTILLTVDVTATTELISSLSADRELKEHRIGILAVTAKAVCLALARHPSLNARWDDVAGEIVHHHYVNLGIAAATDRGLVVPHVKDADAMNLVELADCISALAVTARSGKSSPDDMIGGTFSLTNVGVFGVDSGTPILNPGEAGILALGAVRREPREHHGEVALRDVVTLALSFDHRLVDGEQGSRFLADVGAMLRTPGRAMLF